MSLSEPVQRAVDTMKFFLDNCGSNNMGNTKKLRPMVMTQPVIDAINGELAYQATLQGSGRADAVEHGVAGQLVTLSVYTQEAMVAWAKASGEEKALDALRKVAAIAIRALEEYGCPLRTTANHPGAPKPA